MCGIFGLLGRGVPADVRDSRLDAMERALAHRGPDGAGRSVAGGVALGATRLRIVGEGDSGLQPIASEDGAVRLVCNGEVFDHMERRAALEREGHVFSTDVDVEVALHAYEDDGLPGVASLNAMFALAIHDARRGELHLVRDRFGEKPLFVAHGADGRVAAFASEIPALLRALPERPRVDLEALEEYLAFQSAGPIRTLFAGIESIGPGGALTIDLATGRESRSRPFGPLPTAEGTPEALRAALEHAVARRVAGLRRAGVALSGGLDSSAIAALAARGRGRETAIVGFTGYCDAPGCDERSFARAVAEAAGAPLVEVRVDEDLFAATLEDALRALGEPMAGPGSVGQLAVARAAAKEGVRVLLSGEGADEILGGYARLHLAFQRDAGRRPDASRLGDYRELEAAFVAAPDAVAGYVAAVSRDPSAMSSGSQTLPAAHRAIRAIDGAPGTLVDRLLAFETGRLLPALLAVDDRVTMAAGVESRSPFLDREVASVAAAIPPAERFAGDVLKVPLREAMRGVLPEVVRARTDKMGFPVPLGEWLSRSLAKPLARAAEAIADLRLPVDPRLPRPGEPIGRAEARRLWGILSLGLWATLW